MSRRRPARADDLDQTRVMDQTPPSIAESCPDEDAYVEAVWLEARESGHPVSRRFIRQQLTAAQRRYDNALAGGPVLTYLTRRGSVPVDQQVGERVARRLAGAVL